ncbi:MAG: CHASE2 domain-containing protein [Elainellaceae cyanobacterium]
MNAPPFLYQLTLERVETTCSVHLTWGQGQRLHASLAYPPQLDRLYRDWQRAYLNFYRRLQTEPPPESPGSELRGRLVASGAGTAANTDWQADLSDFQHRLQLELHRWLRSPELETVRQELVKAARTAEKQDAVVDVLITCNPIDLARLPWETWEIGAEADVSDRIRIARTPLTIQAKAISTSAKSRRRPRILVILGDDRGLNFEKEKEAIAPLRKLADVQFIGWQPGKSDTKVKDEIQTHLVDPHGWDALFFAGHSNEKQGQGGELGIAPNGYVRMADMKPLLAIAQQNGLQFALFNSCNGLNLAESLIDLGLSQVIIMREPIHNSVAELFFIHFAQSLAQHKDVHECMLDACQELKTKTALTYPAADLVPSLFRYPNSDLFCIPKRGWRDWAIKFTPTRVEAIALSALLLLSVRLFVSQVAPGAPQRSAFPIQEWLLDQRVLVQAWYRQLTHRALTPSSPEIVLIQIDNESFDRADISDPYPIPYDYMNQLVSQLVSLDATTIGIDYVLDVDDPDRFALGETITAAQNDGIRMVFAKVEDDRGTMLQAPLDVAGAAGIHALAVRSLGDDLHIPLMTRWSEPLVFAHWLAWLSPQCVSQAIPLCEQTTVTPAEAEESVIVNQLTRQMPRLVRSPLTGLGHGLGWQTWLHPITDFSMPPPEVYTAVPAWQLLEQPFSSSLSNLSEKIVLIASGGYEEARFGPEQDSFPPPAATRYWYLQQGTENYRRRMTGGEHHAYLIHHTLTQRWVVPIPNLWMVFLAALLGKVTVIGLRRGIPLSKLPIAPVKRYGWGYLVVGSLAYGVISLELYLSPVAIALPIALPLATYWLYVSPALFTPRS